MKNILNIDLRARTRNYMFYVGIIGVIFSAGGVDFESLTSWSLLWTSILQILNNPVAVVTVFMAVMGVITDTSTSGMSDGTK